MILRFCLLFFPFFCGLLLLFLVQLSFSLMRIAERETETSFKKRYGNHKRSFIHKQHKNDTELSKYIRDLTSAHKVPTIKWCIFRKIDGNAKSDFYKLCLTEKYFILNDLGDNKSLNKKFVNKCRHQKKLLISSVLCEDSVGQIIFSFRYFSILHSVTVLPLLFG